MGQQPTFDRESQGSASPFGRQCGDRAGSTKSAPEFFLNRVDHALLQLLTCIAISRALKKTASRRAILTETLEMATAEN